MPKLDKKFVKKYSRKNRAILLPSKWQLIKFLGSHDFFLWEYYGETIFGKIQAWIFRSPIKVLIKFIRQLGLKPEMILDVGCSPMFVGYPLVGNATSEYIGVDIMHTDKLKKYRDAMRNTGVKTIEVVRANAWSLPFRNESLNFALSLDVLEHLNKPREAAMEIHRVVKDEGLL